MTKKGFLTCMVLCTIMLGACDSKKNEPETSGGNTNEYIPYDETQHFEYMTIGDFMPFCGFPVSVICQKLEEKGYTLVKKEEGNYFYGYQNGIPYEKPYVHYKYRSGDEKDCIYISILNDSIEYISYDVANRGMSPQTAKLWLNQMGNKCLLPTYAKMQFYAAQSGPAQIITIDSQHPFADFDERYDLRYPTYEYDDFYHNLLPKMTVDYGAWCEWFNMEYQQYPDIRNIRLQYFNCDGGDYGGITIEFLNIK